MADINEVEADLVRLQMYDRNALGRVLDWLTREDGTVIKTRLAEVREYISTDE